MRMLSKLCPLKNFVIEAKLSPADVGFVHINQDATVKVDAFDYTIYGNLEGRVVYQRGYAGGTSKQW